MTIQDDLRNLRFDPDTYEFRKAAADRIDELETALRKIDAMCGPLGTIYTASHSVWNITQRVLSDENETSK